MPETYKPEYRFRPEFRARLCAALRSGEFRQGHTYLRRSSEDGDQFCCLGVACELAARDGIIPGAECRISSAPGPAAGSEYWAYDNATQVLPPSVALAVLTGNDQDQGTEAGINPYVTPASSPRVPLIPEIEERLRAAGGVTWITQPGLSVSLATLNDAGLTFSEIADIIEEYL